MRYVRTGGTGGLDVSALCLGALRFGSMTDETTAFAILDRFLDAGGTFIDTANTYAFWIDGCTGEESENLIGRWLSSRGARDRVVLATKAGALPVPLDAAWPEKAEGLAPEVMRRQAEASLRRLGTDRIDVFYSHIEDRKTSVHEQVAGLGALVTDGKVRVLGASNHTAWRIEQARAAARELSVTGYTCVQQRYTYLQPRPGVDFGVNPHTSEELLDYVRSEPDELTLLGYSTLLSGVYSRDDRPVPAEYDHPGTGARIAAVRSVAAETGATPNQVVLAWLLGGSPAVLPIIGVSSVGQLDECLGALELELDAEQRSRLDAA